jgi:hypothetical protein
MIYIEQGWPLEYGAADEFLERNNILLNKVRLLFIYLVSI